MTEPKREQSPEQAIQVEAHWVGQDEASPIFADQLQILGLNDLFYLTFGQLRPPLVDKDGRPGPDAEIRVVASLILPKQALKVIRDMLNSRLGV